MAQLFSSKVLLFSFCCLSCFCFVHNKAGHGAESLIYSRQALLTNAPARHSVPSQTSEAAKGLEAGSFLILSSLFFFLSLYIEVSVGV